jgi:hypothetical protein
LLALVADGARRYSIALELARRGSGWLVTHVGGCRWASPLRSSPAPWPADGWHAAASPR